MSSECYRVYLTGWNVGFRTIDLVMLIRSSVNCDLREAKAMVESVLDGREVILTFSTESDARNFWAAARQTGAIGHVAPLGA
jgi:hypothetical protein